MSRTLPFQLVVVLAICAGGGIVSSVEAAPPAETPIPPAVAQPDRGAIDALIAELNSPDELIRLRAAVTLGLMGRPADAALPALQQASQDANPDIRAAIARAIDRIQGAPGANAAGPNILRLVDRRATVREKLGPDDPRDPVRKTPQKIFSISLQQQRSYVIDLVSTQFDTFLRLENDEGREVAHDDDSGGDLNARLRFVPRTDGVFKIIATAFRPDAAGEFELTVREEPSGPVAGGDQLIDLTNGETQIPGAIAGNDPPDLVRKLPCKVYSVRFVRGEAYQIDMTSREIDSFLRLEDADSREVARDDDGGGNLNARIVFEPTETGIYRIVASSFGGQAGAFDVTVRRIRGGGGLVRPGDPKDADQPVVASLVSSRMVLSHGRLDDLRGAGYASPDNPVSQVVPAIANLFRTLAAQPDPRRVTMDLNTTFNGPRDPKLPSPVFLATMDLPSSMTLLVAELGPPALAQSVSHWEQALPRFGNGNFYATVSMPEFGIVAGQELMTQKHFEVYTANSILWEAPDFGNIVMPRNLEGGTTNLGVAIARGKKEKHVVLNVGWANPLELELAEVSQQRLKGAPGTNPPLRVTIQATLPASFEPVRVIRWAAETRKVNIIGESAAAVVRPNRVTNFVIDLPGDTEGMVRISAVASPGPFVRPLAEVQAERTVRFTTFHSQGPTLEDNLTILAKGGNLEETIKDTLDQAKAKSGDVQISLYWQSKDDLDLHVVTPSGEEIFYGHRNSRCGGQLDVDMNVQYSAAKSGAVENVFWPKGKAPAGKYKVYVNHYSHHGNQPGTADPASFNIRTVVQGQSQIYSGTVSYANSTRRKVLVHEFDVR